MPTQPSSRMPDRSGAPKPIEDIRRGMDGGFRCCDSWTTQQALQVAAATRPGRWPSSPEATASDSRGRVAETKISRGSSRDLSGEREGR